VGYTTQKIGVAVASVANKLSLVIPFVASIYLYSEAATWVKVIGIIIALAAVLLTCWPQHKNETPSHKRLPLALIIGLPALLFIGSGLIDTLVNHVQITYLNETNNNAYLISSFATAATIGSLLLLTLVLTGKQCFDGRSVIAGIAIGVPNYFSIWCLVQVLSQFPGNSSAIIPINNMAIVLFSSLVAWWLFKEHLSTINWIGIVLSLAAIALIAFG
jgi:drug/metabolite transporter (DMT)-like permease